MLSKEHNAILDELDTHKAASDEWALAREEMRQAHESAIRQKTQTITSLQSELSTAHTERDARWSRSCKSKRRRSTSRRL